jgi:hypothetical protein
LNGEAEHGLDETQEPDHSASLGGSIASSTRIRFSVHTGNTDHGSRDGHSDRPVLRKPFKYEELVAILTRLKLAPVE